MGFWIMLAVYAATYVVGELIRPKPEFERARPASLGDFNFPTATEGRCVPILWGRALTKAPNVVWFGKFDKLAITKNVSTGLFSSEDVELGFAYFLSIQFALCRGPGVNVYKVFIGGKFRGGTAFNNSHGFFVRIPDKPNPHHYLYPESLFAQLNIYNGDFDQAADPLLATEFADNPAYRGTCHVVLSGSDIHPTEPAYIGVTPNMDPWSFEIGRIPDGLDLATEDPGAEEPHTELYGVGDANPINVIFEIMTDIRWGLCIASTKINLTNFREAAHTLYLEGHGFSLILDNEREAVDVIDEIERQIDGILYFNQTTGLWEISLARNDYTVSSLDTFDESNIIKLTNFARSSWQETTNHVRVKYNDRSRDYQETYAVAQDAANIIMQQATVSVELSYPGVKYAELANKIAWRELSTLSYPLSKISFTVNREAYALTPGTVFKFSWARLGITDVVFRVTNIDYGEIDNSEIEIDAVQDIFAAGTGVFADPPGTGWVELDEDPVAATAANSLVFEAPRQMVVKDSYSQSLEPRLWAGARNPGGITTGFEMWLKAGPSRPLSGDFTQDANIAGFLLQGTLETALDPYPATAVRPSTTYTVRVNDLDPDDLSVIETSGTASSVEALTNIIKIDDEYIGYEVAQAPSSGVVQLLSIYRGLFNSAPAAHAVNAKVWFIGQSAGNLTRYIYPTSYDETDIQLRSSNGSFTLTEAETPTITAPAITLGWARPLPPRDPKLNGSFAPSSASFDTDYSTETGYTGDDGRGCSAEVTPRAWRIDSVLDDATLSGSSPSFLSDSPEFDFLVTLDPDGTPVDTSSFNVSSTETPKVYMTRNSLIVAMGANASIPTTGRLKVTASHQIPGESKVSADQDLEFDFTVSTALQSADDVTFGGLTKDVASDAVILGETGTYTFDIKNPLPSSGIVQININSGGWTTLISAGTSSNTVAITSGDSVQLKFDQYPSYDQFFDVTGPTSEQGYGVLQSA